MDPSGGGSSGGWTLTIQGGNFLPGAQVALGGLTLTSGLVVSGNQITVANMPPLSAGTVAVQVINGPGLLSNAVDLVIAGPVLAPTPLGPLAILDAAFMPNPAGPGPVQLRFKLGAPASRLRLRLYGRALVLFRDETVSGAWSAGWQSLSLDLDGLPAGLCFATLEAEDATRHSLPLAPLRLFILR